MRTAPACCAGLLALCAAAFTAESPAQQLFNRLRAGVRENLLRVPRYTCVQTVTRTQYRPQYGQRIDSCPALIAARATVVSNGLVLWHDRLRLDVAAGPDSEIFSWAGARRFETGDLRSLTLSGSSGSGDFTAFLAAIFGSDAEGIRYQGLEDTSLGRLAVYDYTVPHAKSHYSYTTGKGESGVAGFGGSFFADPATAQLKRLLVDATEFASGDICRVRDTMDYAKVPIGTGSFLLPAVSRMVALYRSGEETSNETHYSNCHEFTGESTIRFDDADEPGTPVTVTRSALKSIMPKTHIKVKIDPPIDSSVAAAGDPVTGIVERDAKQNGEVVVRTADRLHGRLLRLEQFALPEPYWIVAIHFDSIERQGIEQPVELRPLDDGDRSPYRPIGFHRMTLPPRPPGSGIFLLPGAGNLILDQKFHSEWETK